MDEIKFVDLVGCHTNTQRETLCDDVIRRLHHHIYVYTFEWENDYIILPLFSLSFTRYIYYFCAGGSLIIRKTPIELHTANNADECYKILVLYASAIAGCSIFHFTCGRVRSCVTSGSLCIHIHCASLALVDCYSTYIYIPTDWLLLSWSRRYFGGRVRPGCDIRALRFRFEIWVKRSKDERQ